MATRIDEFEETIASTATYLRGLWPQLDGLVIDIADAPAEAIHGDHIDRWWTTDDPPHITFYRLPIAQFFPARVPRDLDLQTFIRSCVYNAVAELLGRDPWELAPGHYHGL